MWAPDAASQMRIEPSAEALAIHRASGDIRTCEIGPVCPRRVSLGRNEVRTGWYGEGFAGDGLLVPWEHVSYCEGVLNSDSTERDALERGGVPDCDLDLDLDLDLDADSDLDLDGDLDNVRLLDDPLLDWLPDLDRETDRCGGGDLDGSIGLLLLCGVAPFTSCDADMDLVPDRRSLGW